MKRSTGVLGQDPSLTAGTGTALTGWNDQNRGFPSVGRTPPSTATAGVAAFASGQGKPSATQRERAAISRSLSFSLGGIFGSDS